jgi:hypothetical protein
MLLGYFVTNIKIEVLKYQNKIVKIKVILSQDDNHIKKFVLKLP